jgi:hypothetical protein
MKSQQNNICICGHLEKEHSIFRPDSYDARLEKACLFGVNSGIQFVDDCREFKLDNLRYLEDLYEKETIKN